MGLLADLADVADVAAVGAAAEGGRWWRSTAVDADLTLVLAGADPHTEQVTARLVADRRVVAARTAGTRHVAVRIGDDALAVELGRLGLLDDTVGNGPRSTMSIMSSCSAKIDSGPTGDVFDRRLAELLGAPPDWRVRRTPDNPVFALLHTRVRAARTARQAGCLGGAVGSDLLGEGRRLAAALLVAEEGTAYGLHGLVEAYTRFERAGPLLPLGPQPVTAAHRIALVLAAATVGVLDRVLASYDVTAPDRI